MSDRDRVRTQGIVKQEAHVIEVGWQLKGLTQANIIKNR